MASAARSLRLCLRASSRARIVRATTPRIFISRRAFSHAPIRQIPARNEQNDKNDNDGTEGDGLQASLRLTPEEEALANVLGGDTSRLEKDVHDLTAAPMSRPPKVNKFILSKDIWYDAEAEETDPDFLSGAPPEDEDFSEEDIMGMAHGKLEEHREYREYARIAAWQMPLLSSEY
jgi:small subunit ribosomal protein S35